MQSPAHPVAAVSHPDPYPYYAALRAGQPLVRCDALDMWVASRADVVAEALAHPALRVRPAAEPVPHAIVGTAAGGVFADLVRMNDGARHTLPRQVLQSALAAVDGPAWAAACARLAARGLPDDQPIGGARLDDWAFYVPVSAVAQRLGFADDDLSAVAAAVGEFVRCLSPLSTPAQRIGASVAADVLRDRLRALLASPSGARGLAGAIKHSAHDAGWQAADALLANLLGLLSQSYEATAGLLGNGIVALARDPALRDRLRARAGDLPAFVAEIARHDPPVQNTRRFAATPCMLAGVALQPGDAVLVLLASASRDDAAHADADCFDIDRAPGALPTFGAGHHACPGQAAARTIAAAAFGVLLQRDVRWPAQWRYRPSTNARLPLFAPESP